MYSPSILAPHQLHLLHSILASHPPLQHLTLPWHLARTYTPLHIVTQHVCGDVLLKVAVNLEAEGPCAGYCLASKISEAYESKKRISLSSERPGSFRSLSGKPSTRSPANPCTCSFCLRSACFQAYNVLIDSAVSWVACTDEQKKAC